jgi:hypothetical protein
MNTEKLQTARYHASVTKSDTVDIPDVAGLRPRALRVGGAGDVIVLDERGNSITYTCVAGEVLEVAAKRVMNSTTATGIVAWF